MQLEAGERLGRYEVVSLLGAGGMGEVYRARDEVLGREVAVKVLAPSLTSDSASLLRFEREARSMAALSHPNVIAVHDFGRDAVRAYLVTELLEGAPLRASMNEPMPWRKAVETGALIADGLAAAHARGIVHRDLKPENIFVTSDAHLKILDFGLARPTIAKNDAVTERLATEPGMVMGTMSYMSPEQLRGEPAAPSSDVFALGCVLFELVAGKRPFDRPTVVEAISATLRDEPRMPEGRSTPELDAIIKRCLEKDPQQRYQSGAEVASALRTLLTSEPTQRIYVDARPKRPRTVPFIAAAVAIVALIAGFLVWRARTPAAIDSLVVVPFANTSGDASKEYLSDGISDSITNTLARVASLRVVPRATAYRYKGKEAELLKIGRELGVRGVVTGRVMQRGDALVVSAELTDVGRQSQIWGDQFNGALKDIFGVQDSVARQIAERVRVKLSGAEREQLAERATEDLDAYQLYMKGRFEWNKRTRESLQLARDYFQRAIDRDPRYAKAYVGLADSYAAMANRAFMSLDDGFRAARTAAQRALELDDSSAEAHTTLALVQAFYDRDRPAAEREFRRAIELDPRYATAYHWYALLLWDMARLSEARQMMEKATELDPLSPAIQANHAWVLYSMRRFDAAVERYKVVLQIDPDYLDANVGLANTLRELKRYPEAGRYLGRVMRLTRSPELVPVAEGMHDRRSAVAAAGRILANWEERARTKGDVQVLWLAQISMWAENRESAFHWLRRMCEERNGRTIGFRTAPIYDFARSDPRFAEILRCAGH